MSALNECLFHFHYLIIENFKHVICMYYYFQQFQMKILKEKKDNTVDIYPYHGV